MKVVLFQPQIPQNTGNIVRTCAVTGCDLVLVRPLGFSVTDRWLKRAGLDYWEGVSVEIVDDLKSLLEQTTGQIHLFSSKAKISYTDVTYGKDDILVFGAETHGLPSDILQNWSDCAVTIPMKDGVRCLNLATSVGIGIYEAWRQNNFVFS